MSEQGSQQLLAEWMDQRSGTAKITGKDAVNLNPLIRASVRSKAGPAGSVEGNGSVSGDADRELVMAWWWLWLDGSGPVKFSAFNSREDKLTRSWKKPFQHRALLPATWYVEKKGRFHLAGDELFGIAAVTSTVTRDDGTELITYSMVTRDAVGEAAEYWPRMPLVLPRDMHDDWLDPDRPGDVELVDQARLGSEDISRSLTTS